MACFSCLLPLLPILVREKAIMETWWLLFEYEEKLLEYGIG